MVQHLNYGNHLGNDSLLSLIHESRVRFFNHLGYSEKDIAGTAVIMTDVAIVYKSEGFYGDRLLFHLGVADVTPKSFDIFYRVQNVSSGKDLAEAKTGILGFDYDTRKSKSFPTEFISKIQ